MRLTGALRLQPQDRSGICRGPRCVERVVDPLSVERVILKVAMHMPPLYIDAARRGRTGTSMKHSAAIAPGRLSPSEYSKNFDEVKPPLDRIKPRSIRAAACSATTRLASRPARPASTSRASSARSAPATSRARRSTSCPRTSWAACARACARPRFCASRPACATRPKASRSGSGCCSAMPPTGFWPGDPAVSARAGQRQARRRGRRRPGGTCPARTAWRCSATP